MKRLICTLAAFAMLTCTGPPAQAGYQGTLRGDMGWFLTINNNAVGGKTSVTVYFLVRNPYSRRSSLSLPGCPRSIPSQGQIGA